MIQTSMNRQARRANIQQALSNPWWVVLLWGIITIVLGIYMFMRRGVAAVILVEVLGLYWLIGGIIDGSSTIVNRSQPRWGWHLAGAMLSVFAGFAILSRPLLGTIVAVTFLFYLLACTSVVNGLINISTANLLRFTGTGDRAWGRLLLGLLQIAYGVFWLLHPLRGAWTLVPRLGVLAMILGLATAVISLRNRTSKMNITIETERK